MARKQRLALLGATGSIGTSALSVIDIHHDRFELVSVAAKSSWEKVAAIVRRYGLKKAVMWDEEAAEKLRAATGIEVLSGTDGLVAMTTDPDVDVVLNGLVGAIGCLPTLRAIEAGKKVALANKESLVMSGEVVWKALAAHPEAALLPVDSEHSAIFQCIGPRPAEEIETIQLTASGGPFRELPASEFASITPARALKHPTWNMGTKVTIDSSTLMNKGLEVIEAHFLFRVSYDDIRVVVHPQSIVHSMVQFRDGSLMAQLAAPDMRLPILYALSHPDRWPFPMERADLAKIGTMTFFAPDVERFPCLRVAFEAGRRGGTAPALMNAANEIAVPAFLSGKIPFTGIPALIEGVLSRATVVDDPTIGQILEADALGRRLASEAVESGAVAK